MVQTPLAIVPVTTFGFGVALMERTLRVTDCGPATSVAFTTTRSMRGFVGSAAASESVVAGQLSRGRSWQIIPSPELPTTTERPGPGPMVTGLTEGGFEGGIEFEIPSAPVKNANRFRTNAAMPVDVTSVEDAMSAGVSCIPVGGTRDSTDDRMIVFGMTAPGLADVEEAGVQVGFRLLHGRVDRVARLRMMRAKRR